MSAASPTQRADRKEDPLTTSGRSEAGLGIPFRSVLAVAVLGAIIVVTSVLLFDANRWLIIALALFLGLIGSGFLCFLKIRQRLRSVK